jgi:hypothetical protein
MQERTTDGHGLTRIQKGKPTLPPLQVAVIVQGPERQRAILAPRAFFIRVHPRPSVVYLNSAD